MVSTQNTNFAQQLNGNQGKLSANQQKQWVSDIAVRMTQAFKSKSVNQVIWGNDKKK